MNLENEFVPYKQALELKGLGFNEPCFGWFRSTLIPSNFTEFFLETEFGMNESPSDWVNSNFLDKACGAPLYQQAFRWFREKYHIIGEPKYKGGLTTKTSWYDYIIYSNIDWEEDNKQYKTYEEAELECLKKLIEIVKKK
jgi:hypothetical protein